MRSRSGIRSVHFLFYSVALVFVLFFYLGSEAGDQEQTENKQSDNSICYVCHFDLESEEITTVHWDVEISCQHCHGSSVEHMHDETLMTKPDILHGREEVNKMCSNPACHKPGSGRGFYGPQDHGNPDAVEVFFQKWNGKRRPNGRTISEGAVCTDCHGKHNIDRQSGMEATEEHLTDWIALFNGQDMSGWKPSGEADWRVEHSSITAIPGPDGEGGDLWTRSEFEDYLLTLTFKAEWPVRAGVWLRAMDTELGPRIEVMENDDPAAYTGSVFISGRGWLLMNIHRDLVDREGWNTLSVKVVGNRVQVWLNGEEIGSVMTEGPAKGRIGIHIEKPFDATGGKLSIREVLIQRIETAAQ